jgi:hypothetical protein
VVRIKVQKVPDSSQYLYRLIIELGDYSPCAISVETVLVVRIQVQKVPDSSQYLHRLIVELGDYSPRAAHEC